MSALNRPMKPSGVDWIGDIPDTWSVAPAKFFISFFNGSDPLSEGDVPVYGSGSKSFKTCGEYKKGPTVLLGRKGTLEIPQFVCGKYWNVDTAFDAHIRLRDRFSLRFYFYLALCFDYKKYSTQTALPSMTQGDYKNMRLPIPFLEEQQVIADYLDKKCAEIDGLVADIEKQIDILERYKQSVISEAVTKGLDPTAPMKPSGVDWLASIPEHWKPTNPKALFSLRNQRAVLGERQLTASQKFGIVYQDEFMEMENQRVVTVEKDFTILKHVEPNDFVISMRSFQGGLEFSELRGSISSAYVMLIPNKEKVYAPFYRWFFKSSKYINAIQSTTNLVRDGQAMRYANFVMVPLFIVPMAEQREIADYLDKKCADIDALIATKREQLEKLGEYKKSLIYEYVTGKKAVK